MYVKYINNFLYFLHLCGLIAAQAFGTEAIIIPLATRRKWNQIRVHTILVHTSSLNNFQTLKVLWILYISNTSD